MMMSDDTSEVHKYYEIATEIAKTKNYKYDMTTKGWNEMEKRKT